MWNPVLPNYVYFCKHVNNEIKKKRLMTKGKAQSKKGRVGVSVWSNEGIRV